MKKQRKHSGLPPRPPRHPQSSNATDGASPSRGRSKKQILEEETEKKYGQFYPFLKSISLEKKKSDFLMIRIQELRDYLSTLLTNDSRLVLETFEEAIEFGRTNQNDNQVNWGFWVCPGCNHKFTDNDIRVDHLETQHVTQKNLARDVRPPPARWIAKVFNEEWKPVAVNAALQKIEENQQLSDDQILKLGLPLSDDKKCASLLENIQEILKDLVGTGCFPDSNLSIMMDIIKKELMVAFPKSKHEAIERIAQLGLCFMFLDEPHLENFNQILHGLAVERKSVKFPIIDFLDTYFKKLQGKTEFRERIGLSKDGSYLVLDERLLTPDTSVTIEDPFLKWLLCSASVSEELELWTHLKDDIRVLGCGFVKSSDLAWKDMDSWAQESTKISGDLNELYSAEAICSKEDDLRINDPTHNDESYESLIRRELPSAELETVICNAHRLDVAEGIKNSPWDSARQWLVKDDNNQLRRQDAKIRFALHTRITVISFQQCKADSKSLRMERLKKEIGDEFEQASRLDYRAILLPFVKSFLQEKIGQQISQKANDAAAELLQLENKNKGKQQNKNEKKANARQKRRMKKEKALSVTPLLEEEGNNEASSSAVEVTPKVYIGEKEVCKWISEEWIKRAADSGYLNDMNRF